MRARFTDLVPWGLGSGAAHVVLAILLGMSDLARPPEGDLRPGGIPEPEGPEAVMRLETPPAFAPPESVERALILPPTVELPFDRWGQIIECDITDASTSSRGVWEETKPPRAWGSLRVTPPGGVPGEGAILAALRWLARHQAGDGTWTVTVDCKHCLPNPGNDEFKIGVTSLALLAFVRAGYTADSAFYDEISFGNVVRGARRALREAQDSQGCIGPREGKFMYNHALATLALAESANPCLPDLAVARAAEFLVAAQNPGLGWRYSFRPGDNDTSVTTWAVLALLAAQENADDFFDYRGPRAWYDSVTEKAYGRVGYTHKGTGKIFLHNLIDAEYGHHETLTAMSVVARRRIEGPSAPVYSALDFLLRDKPAWEANQVDFVYWHFGSLAFVTVPERDDKQFQAWRESTLRALLPHQNRSSCRNGSWEPVGRWSGEGGRVCATALNALTLVALTDGKHDPERQD